MPRSSNKSAAVSVATVDSGSLYEEICAVLGFEREENEDKEEFKSRVVEAFSDMDEWPNDKYEQLPETMQAWIFDATEGYKLNKTRTKKRKLPPMPGLDAVERRGRADVNAPPAKRRGAGATRERKRQPGSDCVTRVMTELVVTPQAAAPELRDLLATKYEMEKPYSEAAIRYAIQAFNTAKRLLAQPAA